MLQRFRTLFNLPSTIRGSISKGEYDLAVREYKKAKSIALPSHVYNNLPLLLKVILLEINYIMFEMHGLYTMTMPFTLLIVTLFTSHIGAPDMSFGL